MLDEDFLKERQDIREKMLRYSRAVKNGKIPQVFDENEDILKRRVKKDKRPRLLKLEEDEPKTKGNIYLKEDLINVKLEDKKNFLQRLFSKRKKNKNEKSLEKKLALNTDKTTSINAKETLKSSSKSTLHSQKLVPNKAQTAPQNRAQNAYSKLEQTTKNSQNTASTPQSLKTKENLKTSQAPKNEPLKENLKKDFKDNLTKNDPLKERIKESQKSAQTPLSAQEKNPLNSQESTQKDGEEKQNLLQGFDKDLKADRNLSYNQLILAFLFIFFACIIFIPQIYIRNNIYYLSREIAVLRSQESVLNEENKELKRELENLRFKNQILDYLE